MLPEGWRNTIISEACELINGRGFKPHEWSRKGLPIIRIQNLNGSQEYNFYSGEFDKKILVQDGQLLFAWSGSKGTSFGPHIWNGPNGLLNYHTWKVLPKPSANILFLNQYFRYITSHIENKSHGASALVHTQKGEMENISILLPPLPEQKKIAAILSTWDRAIEGTEKLLANSQQQKKALMQQLLTGKKRLPGFTGEWKICSLSDVATVQTATSKTQYICENGERFIVDMGSVNRLGNLVCTKSTQHNADLLPKGTLVMPKDDIGGGNIIGRTSYIDRDDLYVLGDHVYALHIGDCDSKFLHFLINSHPINKNLRRRANGTAQLGLGKKDVLRQKIKIPSEFSEQKAIAAVLTTADEEITALESDLSRLSQEKKALMQQLLTGKRRVTVD